MKKVTLYRVATLNTYRTIAQGFRSYMEARDWILMRDYGQYEAEGGWYIYSYAG